MAKCRLCGNEYTTKVAMSITELDVRAVKRMCFDASASEVFLHEDLTL